MFTGIVEEIGTIQNITKDNQSGKLKIKAEKVLEDTKIGDSIAVNGVCLTVTGLDSQSFTADVMPETLRMSNLGELGSGSKVDLERAMSANGRFGGHLVSGHIDGTGIIKKKRKEGNATWVTIEAGPELLKYIIQKGSITIDGISLTVAELNDNSFSVSLIPHTGEETILLEKNVGDKVNLENDVVGKYIERLMNFTDSDSTQSKSGITMDFLIQNGF